MDMNIENKTFGELLKASMKSDDTEEWIDVSLPRPVGLAFALLWHRLGVTPNTITLLSIALGVAAGAMFYFQNLCYNIIGVVLLVLANLCDSTDGQLARLTNQRSMKGRCLDGFAGDTWFFAIYLAISLRLWHQTMPGTTEVWGPFGLALAAIMIMLINHRVIYQSGFQLSFLAVIGIFYIMPELTYIFNVQSLNTKGIKKLVYVILSSVICSVSINLATLPVILINFYEICLEIRKVVEIKREFLR